MSQEFTPAPAANPLVDQLLVSVRNVAELELALAGGVDIIDLKEPRGGSLAPAPVKFWQSAAARLAARGGERPRLSAALGEADQSLTLAGQLPTAFDFAKAGPSGITNLQTLQSLWCRLRKELRGVELVAVAYADHQAAGCLDPREILQAAAAAGFRHFLLDTYVKDGKSSLDHVDRGALRAISAFAAEHALWWALAGSIRLEAVESLAGAGIRPDCFAVRGDVCRDDRTGELAPQRLERWLQARPPRPSHAGGPSQFRLR